MQPVSRRKPAGGPGAAGAKAQHLEEFAHFVFQHQLVRLCAGRQVGCGHAFGQPAVDEKAPLAGVAQQVSARFFGSYGHGGEVDMGGDVFVAHGVQGIGIGLVPLVAHEGAHGALGVVILALAKAVVDKKGCATLQALGHGADKGLRLQVDFGEVVVRAVYGNRGA